MKTEEWERIQRQIYLLGSLVADEDLDGFIEACDRADAITPFIDPTLWIAKHKDLDRVRDLAVGLREFQKVVRRARAQVGA